MINIDEKKLGAIRKYWRELCMIAMAYTIAFLFRQLSACNTEKQEMYSREVAKKEEEVKFWRDAFITVSKYNKLLERKKDTL